MHPTRSNRSPDPAARRAATGVQFALLENFEPRVLFTGAAPSIPAAFALTAPAKVGYPTTITYNDLLHQSGATDPENDAIAFLFTRVDATAGFLYLKRNGVTQPIPVSANTFHIGAGDVLSFVPLQAGVISPFSVKPADNTSYGIESAAYVVVTDTPRVSLTVTEPNAWEGSATHPGVITLTRTGDTSKPLPVKLLPVDNNPANSSSGARHNVNYLIVDANGHDVGAPGHAITVTIPAGQSSLTFNVRAIEDNSIATSSQQAGLALIADNSSAQTYIANPAAWLAGVTIVESAPTISITPAVTTLPEGVANQVAFTVTRTAAQGRVLDFETFVNLSYTASTFFVGAHLAAPPVAYFAPGETVKQIVVSTTSDGLNATGQTLVAAVSGSGFIVSGNKTGTVTLTDASPVIAVSQAGPTILEGAPNQAAFVLYRAVPVGGTLMVPTTVNLAYSSTSSSFNSGLLTAPSTATFGPGQTSVTVFVTVANNGLGTGNQTLTVTPSGTGFTITGSKTANVTITDAAPTVAVVASVATAVEASRTPGQVIFTRNGSTDAPLNVNFTTGTAATNAVRGVGYSLTYHNGSTITGNTVTIPSGAFTVAVDVVPNDDGINAATTVPITVAAGSAYNLPGTGTASGLTATVTITNNPRTPTVTNLTANRAGIRNTPIEMPFETLVQLTGARLDPNSHGTLQLRVGTISIGTLAIRATGGTTSVAAAANTVIPAGATLIWTPPANLPVDSLTGFTLFALDGNVASLTSTSVIITVI